MAKRSGRKVYRNSTNAKKKRAKKAIAFIIAVIILAALVFVGYSVAKPIVNYFNTESESQGNILPWTPPITDNIDSIEIEDETTETENENITNEIEEDDRQDNSISNGFTAYMLPEDALASQSKLNDYINRAKSEGYNAVLVTMKSKGGKINYATESEFAEKDESVIIGSLTAKQVVDSVKSSGMYAIAVLNLLEDNSRYGENREGSYHNSDGSTWLDNSVANGGKPWLSPFENDTISYIAFLVNEVTTAGFDAVVSDGLAFPAFRNSDLNLIGESVQSSERYKSLINIVNVTNSVTASRGIENIICVNAADVLNGKEEVFKPEILKEGMPVIVEFFPDELGNTVIYDNKEIVLSDMTDSEKFDVVFSIINELENGRLNLMPMIRHNDYDQVEFDKIITILINEDYVSYIVQ